VVKILSVERRKMAGGGSSELRAMAERIAKLEAALETLAQRLEIETKTENEKRNTKYGKRKG
jgi:hypothetical protein